MSSTSWSRRIISVITRVIEIASPLSLARPRNHEMNASPLGRQYMLCLAVLGIIYTAAYGWLLLRTNFLPYVMDNNESFSSLLHAANLYRFGLSRSFGLTDEAYGPNPAAHPYVYTHGGNFPRLFAFLLYVIGAHSIESQIVITTFTVGAAAIFFAYHYFAEVGNPLFALITSLILITDYVFFAQWQVDTYRVWHAFFVFSSLLCAHNIGGKRSKLWMKLTFVNYLFLFYFEYVFVMFVAVFAGLYTAWLYARSPRVLLRAWGVQAAGAFSGVLVLAFQLINYMGFSVLARDVYLTYIARNNANAPNLLTSLQQFYNSYNIVFWFNLVDSTGLRTLRALLRSLFSLHLQVYTPFFTLVESILVAGWFLGLPWWKFGLPLGRGGLPIQRLGAVLRVGARRVFARMAVPPEGDSGLLYAGFVRTSRTIRLFTGFGLFSVSSSFLLLVVFHDKAFLGLPSAGPSFWPPGWLSTGALVFCAAVWGLIFAELAKNRWGTLTHIPPRAVVRASFLMWAIVLLIRYQSRFYNQDFRPLWLAILESRVPVQIGQAAVVAVAGIAVAMALLGTRRVLGRDNRSYLVMLGSYLVCGSGAYGVVYELSPGYVLSGYLERSAPLAVFLTDVAIALGVYIVLKIGINALVRFPTLWSALKGWLGGIRMPWPRSASRPGTADFFASPIAAITGVILGVGLFLFTVSYWVLLQATYLDLLPPNHFAFLKMLKEPPYRGASFAVNTYAAPISVLTGQWAYIDQKMAAGDIQLTDTGYMVERDLSTYLWLADKRGNPDYLKPDYYACMIPQNLNTVLGRLTNQQQSFGACSGIGLVRAARSGHQQLLQDPVEISGAWCTPHGCFENLQFPQDRVVAIDKTGSDSWAIVRLDWDYPPYLKPLPGPDLNTRVDLVVEKTKRGTALHVSYRYVQQEGKTESGSIVRLYRISADESMCLLREARLPRTLFLPTGFTGKIRASVTPHTRTKVGPEYFSQVLQVGSAMRAGTATCQSPEFSHTNSAGG